MSRLIDTDDAYKTLTEFYHHTAEVQHKALREALDRVPGKENKGRWIDDIYCSECGWIHEVEPGFIGSVNDFNYCPNRGAEMENGDE